MAAEPSELVKDGKLDEALAALTEQVRARPADAKLRVFLFQLLCVRGDWERAMTQLNVAADMDPETVLMAQVCRPALNCEAFRAEVFAGNRAPMLFGEPEDWMAWLIQANQHVAQGELSAAAELRDQAFDAAPAVDGTIDGTPFAWVADADTRLGPTLEAIVEGRYYWIPFQNIRQVLIEEPADLRDAVWMPAQFVWANGGNTVGLIPTRYAGSEAADDPGIQLARKTVWEEHDGGHFLGLGQRMLCTDQGEYPLMDVRSIALNVALPEGAEGAGDEADEGDQAEE
ncbi:MAG: type VI secretion system accessory protein TagJ [Planctomycetota bacterium]